MSQMLDKSCGNYYDTQNHKLGFIQNTFTEPLSRSLGYFIACKAATAKICFSFWIRCIRKIKIFKKILEWRQNRWDDDVDQTRYETETKTTASKCQSCGPSSKW